MFSKAELRQLCLEAMNEVLLKNPIVELSCDCNRVISEFADDENCLAIEWLRGWVVAIMMYRLGEMTVKNRLEGKREV